MVNTANKAAYDAKFEHLVSTMPIDDAVKHHVGGIENYYRVGAIEAKILERFGLAEGSYLIDLGCGSGRLAGAIEQRIRYLGVDVVEKLLEYNRSRFPNYRFISVDDFSVPEDDGAADIICAFSLFTHLLHEETFLYIRDAKRVLKQNGRLILSFLEFANAGHRCLFLQAVGSAKTDRPLIVFNERNALQFFAEECGFQSVAFVDGHDAIADFGAGRALSNGEIVKGRLALGQSICVMTA